MRSTYLSLILVTLIAALVAGGCATEATQPELQIGQSVDVPNEPVYVYRGGRDPRTGLAYNQM